MKKVIIIGGGFGGISAAKKLCRFRRDFAVILIDRKPVFDFLPLLPDCIGKKINPEVLSSKIGDIAKDYGFQFINEEVLSLSLQEREVSISSKVLNYDYLVIACGSETNFYSNNNIQDNAYKVDSVNDIKELIGLLEKDQFDTYVIGGGGYTGVELATNLRLFLNKHKRNSRIIIVERGPSILGPLPQWMKDYVSYNLKRLNVDVFLNSTIEKIEDNTIFISGRNILEHTLVVWAAGVKVPNFIYNLDIEKNAQGRIKVDDYLRLNDNCYVIGDAAYFMLQESIKHFPMPLRKSPKVIAEGDFLDSKGNFLRMAVQFAIFQGYQAAKNITRSIKGQKLKKYKPIDFGYIIPMANNRSCGKVFGINFKGIAATIFHFIMCVYRSHGIKNKIGIIKALISGF